MNNLPTIQAGLVHHRAGRLDVAAEVYGAILQSNPDDPEALHLLGTIAQAQRQHDAAIGLIRRAIELQPDVPAYLNNYGTALRDAGRLDEARAALEHAVAIKPDYAKAHYNLAKIYRDLDLIDETMRGYEQAIAIDPNYAKARYSLGLLHLLNGDLARGFEGYEWRWRRADFKSPRRRSAKPAWNGQPIRGGTILLWPEQGMGDMIQFARFAALVAERSQATVILETFPPLAGLFRTIDGVDEVRPFGETPDESFDAQLPLMSVPHVLGTTLATIPAATSYVRTAPTRIDFFRSELNASKRLRVGITWAGNPLHRDDANRSIAVQALSPLIKLDDVQFVSLAKGDAIAPPTWVLDLSEHVRDFADSAALVATLDLVISVDTAAAHLAGAMGKPVWTLLAFAPDWRWMLGREESPWYPSMRLFRQPARGDWSAVIDRVMNELRSFQPE